MSSLGVEIVEGYGESIGELECSAGEMRQVMVNLLSNAMEATPAGGRIVLRVRNSRIWDGSGGRAVRVWVADSGTGMPAAVRRKIFEPFYTTKAKTGNGLGLWVAADLIQQQGGWMKVRSTVEGRWRGTTFLLTLPYNDGNAPLLEEDEAAEPNADQL
jgi:signal transduction histidine kinase